MLQQGCTLSMFHRTCEKLHGGVGLVARLGGGIRLVVLSMPNILFKPFYFPKIKCQGGVQAVQALFSSQTLQIPSQGGVQALFPRQAALVPSQWECRQSRCSFPGRQS